MAAARQGNPERLRRLAIVDLKRVSDSVIHCWRRTISLMSVLQSYLYLAKVCVAFWQIFEFGAYLREVLKHIFKELESSRIRAESLILGTQRICTRINTYKDTFTFSALAFLDQCNDKVCNHQYASYRNIVLTIPPHTKIRTSHFAYLFPWPSCSTDGEINRWQLSHMILQTPVRPQHHIHEIASTISVTHTLG